MYITGFRSSLLGVLRMETVLRNWECDAEETPCIPSRVYPCAKISARDDDQVYTNFRSFDDRRFLRFEQPDLENWTGLRCY